MLIGTQVWFSRQLSPPSSMLLHPNPPFNYLFLPFPPNILCVFLNIHIDFLGIQIRHACDHGLAPFSSLTYPLPVLILLFSKFFFLLRHLDPPSPSLLRLPTESYYI